MLSTPRFSTLPATLQSTPLIGTVPARMTDYCKRFGDLVDSPLPIELPDIQISLINHARLARLITTIAAGNPLQMDS